MSTRELRQLYHTTRRKVSLTWRRLFHAISAQQMDDALSSLMRDKPSVLLVHSSLSSCGFVPGGAEGVIHSLSRRCDTLCLPTHSYCYSGQVFDPRRTPSMNGLITDVFWRMDDVQRSAHPTHSLAARGPLAEQLCEGHIACGTACGPGTPYQKLIQRDASVLMFGATMNTYTLFHCAEDAAGCSYLYEPEGYELSVKDHAGKAHSLSFRRQDMTVPRRFEQMRDELRGEDLLRTIRLGLGELLLIPSSRQVHDYTVGKLRENELHLVARAPRGHAAEVQTAH